jgi:hypothetical protein
LPDGADVAHKDIFKTKSILRVLVSTAKVVIFSIRARGGQKAVEALFSLQKIAIFAGLLFSRKISKTNIIKPT